MEGADRAVFSGLWFVRVPGGYTRTTAGALPCREQGWAKLWDLEGAEPLMQKKHKGWQTGSHGSGTQSSNSL